MLLNESQIPINIHAPNANDESTYKIVTNSQMMKDQIL